MRSSLFLSVILTVLQQAVADSAAQQPLTQWQGSDVNNDLVHDTARLDWYIENVMEEWHTPGLAVSVVKKNTTWARGYGYASLPSVPVTPETLFFTGSTTKSFTAAAFSLLVDDSSPSVKWTTPVSEIIREDFVLSDEWATHHITIEDILSHRTGYPRHDLAFSKDTRELVRKLRYLPMSAEPRTKFQYNNMMYGVAGYIIEKLAGSSLRDFFHTRLWQPIGLDHTFLGLDDPALRDSGLEVADEYYYDEYSDEYLRLQHANVSADAAAGAAISNVLDYAKYLRVLLNEELPISEAGHRELKTPRSFYGGNVAPFVGPITYALGWMSGVVLGEQIWLHSGQVDGFTTWMLILPSKHIGITVMTNAASKALSLVLYRVLYDLLNVKEEDRFDFAAKFRKDIEAEKQYLASCPKRVYPDLPSPPLPPTSPLANHTGRYRDAGTGDFDVLLDCNKNSSRVLGEACKLQVRKVELGPFPWPFILNLEHKSGDYWLGWPKSRGTDIPATCLEVQFRVDVKGVVSHLGFNARLEDDAPLVWFERVD